MLALAVVASGCTQVPFNGTENNGDPPSTSGGSGLQVVKFAPVSPQLRPGQETVLELRLRNHHVSEDVTIERVELYGFEPLEASETTKAEACQPQDLQPKREGIAPEMECRFRVKAPSREDLSGFSSRGASPRVRVVYSSKLVNDERPLDLEFRPAEEMENPRTVTRSYSNSEINVQASVDQPVPSDLGTRIKLDVTNAGRGSLEGGYELSFTPSDIFEGECSGTVTLDDPIEDHGTVFCEIGPSDTDRVTRKLTLAVSYKYVLSPGTDVEVKGFDEG